MFVDDADCDDLASGVAQGFGAALAFAATSASLRMSSVVGMLAIAATELPSCVLPILDVAHHASCFCCDLRLHHIIDSAKDVVNADHSAKIRCITAIRLSCGRQAQRISTGLSVTAA